MVAFQQRHLRCLDLGEALQARTEDVETLVLDAVEGDRADMMTGGHSMTGDPAVVCHRASGGGVKHHQSESPASAGEEEAAAALEQDRKATGMDVEEDDGDLLRINTMFTSWHHGFVSLSRRYHDNMARKFLRRARPRPKCRRL